MTAEGKVLSFAGEKAPSFVVETVHPSAEVKVLSLVQELVQSEVV